MKTQELLKFGADPNEADSFGEAPLFEAASSGNANITATLLLHSADPTRRNRAGSSCLEFTQDRGIKALIAIYLDQEVLDMKDAFDPLKENLRANIERQMQERQMMKFLGQMAAPKV